MLTIVFCQRATNEGPIGKNMMGEICVLGEDGDGDNQSQRAEYESI